MSSAIVSNQIPQPEKFKRFPLRALVLTAWFRMTGNFHPVVAFSKTIGVGLQARFGWFRLVYLHRPEHIEIVCVKSDKSYTKPSGIEGLRRFIGNGLLTSEGQFHLRQRRMIQPAFHKKRIAAYGDCMVAFTRERMAQWQDGVQLDIHEEMMEVTLAIIAKTMFNADVSADAKKVAHALEYVNGYQERYNIRWIGRIFDALPLPSTLRLKAAMQELDDMVYRIIAEHCDDENDSGDLLSMLLSSKAEEDGGTMSGPQLRDECLTLFLAGHETTAVLMSWLWMLVSQHPEVEEKLHAEVDAVLCGRDATVEDLESLVYCRYVVTEAMRLYPPAYVFGRQASEDNQVGPHLIRRGTVIGISPFIIHRQPEWYPEPERFDPDRWQPERCASLPKFAYCPFGGGSRKCIGDQFAWMEATLILATIAQAWKIRLKPGHQAVPDPQITLRPKNGMPVVLEKRNPGTSVSEADQLERRYCV